MNIARQLFNIRYQNNGSGKRNQHSNNNRNSNRHSNNASSSQQRLSNNTSGSPQRLSNNPPGSPLGLHSFSSPPSSPQQRRPVVQLVRQNASGQMNGAHFIVKAKVNQLLTYLVGLKETLNNNFIVGGSMAVILYILTNKSLSAQLLDKIVRPSTDVDLYIKDAGILRRVGPINTPEPFQRGQYNRTKEIETHNYDKVDLTYISNRKFDDMQTVDVSIVGHTFRVIAPNVLLETYKNHEGNIFNANPAKQKNKRNRASTKINILRHM